MVAFEPVTDGVIHMLFPFPDEFTLTFALANVKSAIANVVRHLACGNVCIRNGLGEEL